MVIIYLFFSPAKMWEPWGQYYYPLLPNTVLSAYQLLVCGGPPELRFARMNEWISEPLGSTALVFYTVNL